MQTTRIIIPNVEEDERIGSSFNHLIRVVEETNHAHNRAIWDFKEVHFLHPFFLAPLEIHPELLRRCEQVFPLERNCYPSSDSHLHPKQFQLH